MAAQRRATQRDVARLAGVSQATVSYALASLDGEGVGPPIAPETLQRVLAAAEQLGYRPDIAAQRMRGRNSRIMGVHTYGDLFPISADNYNHEYLLGVQLAAEEAGYDLLMFTSTTHGRSLPTAFLGTQNRLAAADGAVIIGFREDHGELAKLMEQGYPFVRIGRRDIAEHPTLAWVDADFTEATADLLAGLAAAGFEDMLYVGSRRNDFEPWLDRRAGVALAADRGNVSEVPIQLAEREELSASWLAEQFVAGRRTFVAEHHQVALRIAQAATDLGVHLGNDLAIAVLQAPMSDPAERAYAGYLLEPRLEMGRVAGEVLVDVLDGVEPAERGIVVPASSYVARRRRHSQRRHDGGSAQR
ncbi:LacI family DNA-binding transcriptional regulator [Propionibacteriaceae bacterium Y2011]